MHRGYVYTGCMRGVFGTRRNLMRLSHGRANIR